MTPRELIAMEASSANRLAALATEFMRARASLDAELSAVVSDTGPHGEIVYYRLRDVALATLDFARELLRVSGTRVEDGHQVVVDGLMALVGDDRDVRSALETLAGLTNAHVLAFMGRPPTRPLAAGRAASLVVAEFLDAFFGDRYLPR